MALPEDIAADITTSVTTAMYFVKKGKVLDRMEVKLTSR